MSPLELLGGEIGRGLLAALLLFAVAGHGAARLLPAPLAPWRPLFVLPLGAVGSGLAMTALGFARLPLPASIRLVLAAGVLASLLAITRGRRPPPLDRRALVLAALAALAVTIALVPVLRMGFATIPGHNPDAHLVTGSALLLAEAPPEATRVELPVDRVPELWRSKVPLYYLLAAPSEIANLDPIEAFPAVTALVVAFVAVGFALFAIGVLGLGAGAASLAGAAAGLNAMTLHLALHPYYNQLWGLALLPFAMLFGWLAVRSGGRAAWALFALTLLFGALAYPLMAPYPLLFVAGVALRERRLTLRWPPRSALVAGALALLLLASPIYGVFEKIVTAATVLADPNETFEGWRGDITEFIPLGDFVAVGGGVVPALAVLALAALGLWRAVPRGPALALAVLLAISALLAVRLRIPEFGPYFDFKNLSTVGPLALALAVAGGAWLAGRSHPAPVVLGVAALCALGIAAARETRHELDGTIDQVTPRMLELRAWSAELPRAASVRIDIPPSGRHLWAAYFMARHPLNTPFPEANVLYPQLPFGTRADYSLTLRTIPVADPSVPLLPSPTPPNAVDPPLRVNDQFVLRRLKNPPGPETASRATIQPAN